MTGQLKLTSQTQLLTARHYFVTRGKSVEAIAKMMDLDANIIRRWVVNFDWKEMRDRILFRTFQKLQELTLKKSDSMDDRHSRLGAMLEDIIEDLLSKHYEGGKLDGKDVSQLAKALKDMQDVRRTAIGKAIGKTEHHTTIELDTTEAMSSVALALSDAIGVGGRLLNRPKQRLKVEIGDAMDTEYEGGDA